MRHFALTAVLASVLAACADFTAPGAAGPGPQFAISDGAHSSGNTDFYFLSPMVSDPAVSGIFDPTVDVAVKVCPWTGTTCGAELAVFTQTSGSGGSLVTVDMGKQAYSVDWRTRDFPVDPGQTYRIRVLRSTEELGFADVQVVLNNQEARNVNTGEYIPLVDGHILKIRFRIERPLQLVQFTAGAHHTCGLTVSGAAYCWGWNAVAQLGVGTISSDAVPRTPIATPTAVLGNLAFVTISGGWDHTCGLTAAGAAYCWGYNGQGQLGNGTMSEDPVSAPVAVSGGHAFTMLEAGNRHTCGITLVGTAYCWGYNLTGQIGDGTTTNASVPTAVGGSIVFASLALHLADHTCGLSVGGVAYCWGDGSAGQLGVKNYRPSMYETTPTLVSGSLAFVSLAVGPEAHTCGLTGGGAAWCWGSNWAGTLGDGTTNDATAPVPVSGGLTFKSLAVSDLHTCGLTLNGAAYCWGRGDFGNLGNGLMSGSIMPPTAVIGGQSFVSLTAGEAHTCALTATGTAYCWGSNWIGQLGDGSTANASGPNPVSGGLSFRTP